MSNRKTVTWGEIIYELVKNRPLRLVLDFLLQAQAQNLRINRPSRLNKEKTYYVS